MDEAGIAAGDMKLGERLALHNKDGLYGTAYLQRALVTAIGLGANRPQDAVYPTSEGPDVLKKYSGEKKYRDAVRQGPAARPVDGFWSLTMYDKDYFFVDNPLRPVQREPAQQAEAQP